MTRVSGPDLDKTSTDLDADAVVKREMKRWRWGFRSKPVRSSIWEKSGFRFRSIPVPVRSGPGLDRCTPLHEITCDQGQITGQEDVASCEPLNQDTYLGGVDVILKKFVTGGYNYAVVIDNLEKDLTPSTVMKFILKETNINSGVHIFPSLLADMYTRGVIEVNPREELIQLNDFQ